MWAYNPKIAEIVIFKYTFAQKRDTPLSDFFTKFGLRRESLVRTFMSNFTIVGFKMWACNPQNHQNWYFFSYKFAQKGKGYTPYAIFTKFGLVKEVSGTHSHTKFHQCHS